MGAGAQLWIWDSTNEKWVKLAGTSGGAMSIHAIVEELNDVENVSVASPSDEDFLYWDDPNSLWKARALVDADIPATIARDSEVDADIAAHEAAADPHAGYVLNAELTAHESDTSTHGVTEVDGVTERDAAIATHAGNASAHHAKYTDAEAVAAVKASCYVPRTYVWFLKGTVATGTEQGPTFRMKRATTVEDIELHVKTAPVGAALIVDINEAGTSLFSTRPEIDDGGTTEDNNHVFSDTSLAAGAELTMDVDQVGSSTAGADLTVLLHCKEYVI